MRAQRASKGKVALPGRMENGYCLKSALSGIRREMAGWGGILGSVLVWIVEVLIVVGILKLPFTRMQIEGMPVSHELQFNQVTRQIFDSIDVHPVGEILCVSGVKNISVFDLPYHFKGDFSSFIYNLISPSSRKVPNYPRRFQFLRPQESGNSQVSVLALLWLKPLYCDFRSCFHSNIKGISWPYVYKVDHYFVGFRRINSVEIQRSNLDTRPLLALHHLDLIVSSLGTFLSGISGYQSNFIIATHQISLSAHVPSLSMYFLSRSKQDFLLSSQQPHLLPAYVSQDSSEYPLPPVKKVFPPRFVNISNGDGWDARDFYAVYCICCLGCYIASMWIGGNGLYLWSDERRRWRGGILIALATILVIAATITGASGCPPWRWVQCLHDCQQQNEYR